MPNISTIKTPQLQIASFKWAYSFAGYEWKRSVASKLHLYERNATGVGAQVYEPMIDAPGLFREFAELRGKDAIREFANRRGVLFYTYDVLRDCVKEKGTFWTTDAMCGTSLGVWETEIEDIAALIAIWDAISSSSITDLARTIFWRAGKGVEYRINAGKRRGSRVWLERPGNSLKFREGDLLLPARYALKAEINKRLSGELDQSEFHKIASAPYITSYADGTQNLTIMPPNLLGAMWLQFAQFASGRFELKRCPGCGEYFQAGNGAKRRADAITCSDACRQRKKRGSA
jgi:hypothetical protein